MTGPRILCLRVTWRETALPLAPPGFGELNLQPSTGHLAGRKGSHFAQTWRAHGEGCAGMLLLDGDVAADPEDRRHMLEAIAEAPGIVHAAPARLWVRRSGTRWMQANRRRDARGLDRRDLVPDPDTFSFCLTYLPRELIEACIAEGMEAWEFPKVDSGFMRAARETGLPIAVVPASRPVHMHY